MRKLKKEGLVELVPEMRGEEEQKNLTLPMIYKKTHFRLAIDIYLTTYYCLEISTYNTSGP